LKLNENVPNTNFYLNVSLGLVFGDKHQKLTQCRFSTNVGTKIKKKKERERERGIKFYKITFITLGTK
jgi:hypothetical protein